MRVGVSYLGEYCASGDDKSDIDQRVNWVNKCVVEIEWRRHVIGNTTRSIELGGTFLGFPGTDQLNKNWEYSISDSFLNVDGGKIDARLLEKREYSI